MSKKSKTKLELTWIGKDKRPKLEPRILVEDSSKSYHASHKVSENDIFDNKLIYGDNLLALKALEKEYSGKIKCIYIDPPYNTGSAFDHYDDGVEHSLWLSLIRERLEIIWRLLEPAEGSLWVSIDDREMPYLRVIMDEVCGRNCYLATNVWQKRYSRENRESIGDAHEYVLVYVKDKNKFKASRNKLPLGEKQKKIYKNPNNDSRGLWRSVSLSAQGYRPNQMYEIVSPITGKVHTPPPGSCWKVIEPKFKELLADNRIYFGKDGNAVPGRIQFLKDIEGMTPWTWWPHEEAGHTDEAKKEMHALYTAENAFSTPKPERLIERILHIATNPGDLVLDSFAGSGTTGAVAHKMGRKWILVELEDSCHTHIIPRLKKVIDGEDQGGISTAVNWQGGGGFRYFKLAPSLLEQDRWGRWVISKDYDATMLAEAICKLEGFSYLPSDTEWWNHGYSTEQDRIYVTTQTLSVEQLQALSEEVGEDRTLLVCCSAFRCKADRFPNLTLKKIPKMVLSRCEWGHDDYSLNVENLPMREKPKEDAPAMQRQAGLFDNEGAQG
ncbi:site-specific DNA-methyltransferase [Gynuella sunshinyii]|uniref:site-specific DNA-methyltransferase (adenine-specific) n=1 Tax=Gynuella sunshinyii YC6258 TaxID=1445510 RepID=A0A0C5VQQ3_9GAMM|nr:site-specific DNA-methyltransferase [Gynuella sunshinyii]AJQ96932.1 adenine specific DNA methylase Mod [Gynuella sunshinyii YC6258]